MIQNNVKLSVQCVWLVTSPAQIKTLWSKVTELLGDASTPLQQAALAIPPLDAGDE